MTTAQPSSRLRVVMRRGSVALGLLVLVSLAACAQPPEREETHAGESWSVTGWGESFEVYPEAEPLRAGSSSIAYTHVTRLEDFSPLDVGRVEIVLRGAGGEQVFGADEPASPGVFEIAIEPDATGEFDLAFRVRIGDEVEEIAGGSVRVGDATTPGALLVAPAPRGSADAGEPLDFLKEEQWRADFATGWVRSGALAESVVGLARVRPSAGGESSLTAPVAGVLEAGDAWPFVGLEVAHGAPLFRLVPHTAAERSLATLEAELESLSSELNAARHRLDRLVELLELEATSDREVEEARTLAATLEATHAAAQRDLAAARSSREGGSAGALTLHAPFAGEIASVSTTPGATVASGDPLARLVKTDVVWLDVALAPADAVRLPTEGIVGVILTVPEREPLRIDEGLRLVSVAPEVSARTGTVTALVEVSSSEGLILGSVLEARLLLPTERDGVVVPASALIDDSGVPIVYLQLAGESFVRQEVRLVERHGDRALVELLVPGQRLVERGGNAIRRSSLMASGDSHGHIH